MRFDIHRHSHGGKRFAGRGRGFSFGPSGFHFDFGDGPGGWGGSHRRRDRKRMFEGGELRLVLLKLIADEPRHGYELIKAIEDMTGGDYAPSPGIVYPTLTMLEDMGLIRERKSKDAKKIFEATDDGRTHLEENADEVEELIERLEESKPKKSGHPNLGRAVGNLMTALKNRVAEEGWNDELVHEVTAILDEAAQRIERAR